MQIEHLGHRPNVDPTAWIAPTATISGAVTVGPRVRILHGAVLTAEGGAELAVGEGSVIMEHAVLRAAGRFPLRLDAQVLVGPHAYLTGCRVGARCFIATGAMIFNGSSLGEACTVALGGKVHIDSELPSGTRVPIGFVAFGRPAKIYSPEQVLELHEQLDKVSFMRYVFGVDPRGQDRPTVVAEALEKYVRALEAHRTDRVVRGG